MNTHNVTLVFEDGRAVRFDANEDDNLYFACLKNRVRLLTDCLEGACATCKGLCTSGTYYLDEYTDEALTAEEFAKREVLTCQMHVTSDCVIEFPYESNLALKSKPDVRMATVVAADMVSSTVSQLVVKPNSDQEPIPFLPGQYVHLAVPGTDEHRSYSFANAASETGAYTFYIKILENGEMSNYLTSNVKSGDEMTVEGPFGRFYMRPINRPILMVAGGTGLAPMLSMLDTMAGQDNKGFPVHLLYGANHAEELFGLDQIAGYGEQGLDLSLEVSVVDADNSWEGESGHVTDLLRPDLLNGGDCDVYLCGPPPMIDAANAWLVENDMRSAQIYSEKFVAS